MNGRFRFNIIKKRKLHHILRQHLRQTAVGQQILQTYAQDKKLGQIELAAYLQEHLAQDEPLAKQIAKALGRSYDKQFTTIVTGGQIGQLINAKNIENLHQRIYIFSSTWQVITFLLIVIATVAGGAYGAWLAAQPDEMTGDFNIAVAEFVETGLNLSGNNEVATAVSQRIFSLLEGQYSSNNIREVQVAHNKIGIITNAEEARELAEKIHADLVIYGDVTIVNDQVLIMPRFYVSDTYRTGTREVNRTGASEVNGEHQLAAPINFNVADLVNPSSGELSLMQQRAAIFIEFTQALVYLGSDDLVLAEAAIVQATAASEEYGEFDGKEVLYLFASQIARLQPDNLEVAQEYAEAALAINNSYGRALIAQANIYYDLSDLNRARAAYEQAQSLKDQQFGSFITEKASLGLGNVYVVQYQEINRNPEANDADKIRYANEGIKNYQLTIDAYLQQPDNDLLKDMAALAYYGSGIIYHTSGQCTSARQVLKQAKSLMGEISLIISNKENLIIDIDRRLEELKLCEP